MMCKKHLVSCIGEQVHRHVCRAFKFKDVSRDGLRPNVTINTVAKI